MIYPVRFERLSRDEEAGRISVTNIHVWQEVDPAGGGRTNWMNHGVTEWAARHWGNQSRKHVADGAVLVRVHSAERVISPETVGNVAVRLAPDVRR